MTGSIQSFKPNDSTVEYVFPKLFDTGDSVPAPIQEQVTSTRPGVITITGADGVYDLLGSSRYAQTENEIRFGFYLVRDNLQMLREAMEELEAACFNRSGVLYARNWEVPAPGTTGTLTEVSTRRFLAAKCIDIAGLTEPSTIHGGDNPFWPVDLTFLATDPTWYEDYGANFSPALASEMGYDRTILRSYDGTGIAFNLTGAINSLYVFNRGTKPARNLSVILAVTTGTVSALTIENRTTGEEITVTPATAIGAGESITINNGARQVTRSMANDLYGNTTLGDTQVDLLSLGIGANDLRIAPTGTLTGTLTFALRMPYVM